MASYLVVDTYLVVDHSEESYLLSVDPSYVEFDWVLDKMKVAFADVLD